MTKIAIAIATIILPFALTVPCYAQENNAVQADTSATAPHGGSAMKMKSSPNAAKAAFDHQFLDTMSSHHQGSIDMAQLVETRSAHDELKKMAKKMIDDQQGEISQLQSWKKQWYADKGDAMNMNMPGMDSMKNMPMQKMKSSKGAAFDTLFLDTMIRHHAGAIRMAQGALNKAQHQEVKDFSKKVISTQQEEIDQMKKWKAQWKLSGKQASS